MRNFFYLNINLKVYLLSKEVSSLRLWQEMGSNAEKRKNKVYDVREKHYFKKLYNL